MVQNIFWNTSEEEKCHWHSCLHPIPGVSYKASPQIQPMDFCPSYGASCAGSVLSAALHCGQSWGKIPNSETCGQGAFDSRTLTLCPCRKPHHWWQNFYPWYCCDCHWESSVERSGFITNCVFYNESRSIPTATWTGRNAALHPIWVWHPWPIPIRCCFCIHWTDSLLHQISNKTVLKSVKDTGGELPSLYFYWEFVWVSTSIINTWCT